MGLELGVSKLNPAAVVPKYMSAGAAGMDLCSIEDIRLAPGERTAVSTGLAFAIPEGYEGQVRPRSGLALRHGLTVANAPGTIDCDYRGELKVLLVNLGSEPVYLSAGERVAQLIIAPVARAEIVLQEQLDATERGAGGFGSTGK